MKAISVMFFLLISILSISGLFVWFYVKNVKLSNSTARRIEIFGYFLLFSVLVWELWVKGIMMESFYNANFYYITEKLGYIFMMLESISKASGVNEDAVIRGFHNAQQGSYVQTQMMFVDITEAILKIVSTVSIAIGRFQELSVKAKE